MWTRARAVFVIRRVLTRWVGVVGAEDIVGVVGVVGAGEVKGRKGSRCCSSSGWKRSIRGRRGKRGGEGSRCGRGLVATYRTFFTENQKIL